MHLIIDGFRCDRQKLQDLELIYSVLDEYPARIAMTKIMPPYVFRYNGVKPEDWGVSGFVLIAESHISIHTFPDRDYINVDIFTCKEFDTARAEAYIRDRLGLAVVETRVIERGLEYLEHPRAIREAVVHERQQLGAQNDARDWIGAGRPAT